MAEITRETIKTEGNTVPPVNPPPEEPKATGSQTGTYIVYFLFGVLEILLGFRLVLKLLGANPASGFVNFIYSVTGIFTFPFRGIFPQETQPGLETVSVFEPSTLVAIIVYALIAWGIVKLIQIGSGKKLPEE